MSSLDNEIGAEIKLTQSFYAPGNTVHGTLVLRSRRQIEHSGIYVKCACFVAVHWNLESDKRTLVNTEGGDEVYIQPGVLETGLSEFQLEFVLSHNVPPTCMIPTCQNGNTAEIAHRISATILFPNSMDFHATRELVVKKQYKSAPINSRHSCRVDGNLWRFRKCAIVQLKVEKNVFEAGERIPIIVNLHKERSSDNVPAFVALNLQRKIIVRFPGMHDSTFEMITSFGKLDFQEDWKRQCTIKFQVPGNIPPSVETETFCNTYQLVVQIDPHRSKKNLAAQVDVRIGLELK